MTSEKAIIDALRDGWELRTFNGCPELLKPLEHRRRADQQSVESLLAKGVVVLVREVGDQRVYKLA